MKKNYLIVLVLVLFGINAFFSICIDWDKSGYDKSGKGWDKSGYDKSGYDKSGKV